MKAVDTSFLVDYLDEPEGGPAGQFLEDNEGVPLFTPTLAFNEVSRGAMLSAGAETVENLTQQLDWLGHLPFTEGSAREAVEVERELRDAGEVINRMDLLIAGTIRDVGGTIVTADEHFERVTGLPVDRYDE